MRKNIAIMFALCAVVAACKGSALTSSTDAQTAATTSATTAANTAATTKVTAKADSSNTQDKVRNSNENSAHNSEALQHVKQMLDNPYDSVAFAAHSDYVMSWASTSHDIDVNIDEQIGELMGTPYIMGYIAACIEAELTDGVPSMDWPRFLRSMRRLVAFYRQNRAVCGTAERLERYAALDSAQFEATIRQDFAELIH